MLENLFNLLLAFGLGALIGIERGIYENETEAQKKPFDAFGGVRSFGLICFLGALIGIITSDINSYILVVIGVFLVSAFILSFYIISSLKNIRYSLSPELSAIITFFLGLFVSIGQHQIAIVMAVFLTVVLGSETYIDKLIDKISRQEFNNTIKFAVIALVILPLLPNSLFSIADLFYLFGYEGELTNKVLVLKFFNPYGLWFFVVMMSGISYIGYVMSKFIGEKSTILVQGAIGGMASSTALTASMSELSRNNIKNRNLYVTATLIASIIMFLRVLVIVLIFNINLLSKILIPSILMIVGLILYIIIFYNKSKKQVIEFEDKSLNNKGEVYRSPFRIAPALKFALIVLLTKFIAGLGAIYSHIFGDAFFYALGIISGGADADALAQTMAVSAKEGFVGLTVAGTAIILGVMSNNMVKGFMAMKFGEKKFGLSVMIGFLVTMFLGIIGLLFINI